MSEQLITKTLPVTGMTCASCAGSVESILVYETGVKQAVVNLATNTVQVQYDAAQTTPEKLQTALQEIGFDLILADEAAAATEVEALQEARYKQLQFRTRWALIFAVPLMVIGMLFMDMPYANYIMWALATPVVLWLGRDFYVNAWRQAKHGLANMDTLVALSTGIAYLFSVFNTLFPEVWHRQGLHPHVYFEAAAVIIAFILLGKLLEEKAKGQTSTALKELMSLQPTTVHQVLPNGQIVETPIAAVQVGDVLLVKPGETIAVDGVVTNGASFVDESRLTGEPIPIPKGIGQPVYSGTINQKGSFNFRTEKVGANTVLAQIIRRVQAAQGSKAPVQQLVDKVAAVFVPTIVVIALLTLAVWLLAGGRDALTHGLVAMITVLVIACPCALGLATPTALMVGIGKAAENGILIRDAESLERTHQVTAVVLDKTGTLTEGKPKVTDMMWASPNRQEARVLLSIEQQSEHPLAEAVVAYLTSDEEAAGSLQPIVLTNFESLTGQGVKAAANGATYLVGNRSLLKQFKVEIEDSLNEFAEAWEAEAKTVIWLAKDTATLAVIALADTLKSTSKAAVQALQQQGLHVYMLTGDAPLTAQQVAKSVGIDVVKAGVLPHEKADFIKQLQQQGEVVAMVGDGINDSAALAEADVSIAMGKGSDLAKEVAKMTIISSDLTKIGTAIRLSKQTVRTIRQNLFWAFIYNIIGIPLAAGVLYPVNGFLLNPMIAGAAMAFSSVSVVLNSLRLKWMKIGSK